MLVVLKRSPYKYSEMEKSFLINTEPQVTASREYVVYGVSIVRVSDETNAVYFTIEDDHGVLTSAPQQIWDIVDGSVFSGWEIVRTENGSVFMEPPLLQEPGFVDRHSDGNPEDLKRFDALKAFMKSELGH